MHLQGTMPQPDAPRGDMRRPGVVYIAGSGRSGSTLLERALGGAPGYVNVGELVDLFRRVATADELCGCGRPFRTCPFWSAVGETAFDGWREDLVSDAAHLQQSVARQRHIPRLMAPRGPFRRQLDQYQDLYRSLYRAILEQSGQSFVVDASKWPAQALALAGPGIDVRVIHIVRDARGVAHSMRRRDIVRPHAQATTEMMSSSAPAGSALRWTLCQSEVELLRLKGVPIAHLRYEAFVADPRQAIEQALSRLGLTPDPGAFDHVQRGHMDLTASHGLSGNPSRFKAGRITVALDEAWRTQMSQRDRLLVAGIAAPQLLASRIRGRRNGQETRVERSA